MSPRERIDAMLSGAIRDKLPSIGASDDCDAIVLRPGELASGDQVKITFVLSPFARAIRQGTDVLKVLEGDPDAGNTLLYELEESTSTEIERAEDGVFYFLDGASPEHSSPMQYGGFFLELDRRLLDKARGKFFNVIYVNGHSDPYIDFVSDLPAHGFAWEDRSITPNDVSTMRSGALLVRDFTLDLSVIDLLKTKVGI